MDSINTCTSSSEQRPGKDSCGAVQPDKATKNKPRTAGVQTVSARRAVSYRKGRNWGNSGFEAVELVHGGGQKSRREALSGMSGFPVVLSLGQVPRVVFRLAAGASTKEENDWRWEVKTPGNGKETGFSTYCVDSPSALRLQNTCSVLKKNAVRAYRRCQIFLDKIRIFRDTYIGRFSLQLGIKKITLVMWYEISENWFLFVTAVCFWFYERSYFFFYFKRKRHLWQHLFDFAFHERDERSFWFCWRQCTYTRRDNST